MQSEQFVNRLVPRIGVVPGNTAFRLAIALLSESRDVRRLSFGFSRT
jgi:hypothetical protein